MKTNRRKSNLDEGMMTTGRGVIYAKAEIDSTTNAEFRLLEYEGVVNSKGMHDG